MALCLQSFGNCQCWKDMTACPTGGKTDEFAGFKLLARQIHPQTGGGVLLVEADNLAAVQKHTYPWTKGLAVTATITPGLSDEEYVELEESMSS